MCEKGFLVQISLSQVIVIWQAKSKDLSSDSFASILQRRAYLTILSFHLEVLISVHFFFAFKDVLIADAFRYFVSCLAFQKDALELMTSDSDSAVFPELGPSYFYFLLQCYLNL